MTLDKFGHQSFSARWYHQEAYYNGCDSHERLYSVVVRFSLLVKASTVCLQTKFSMIYETVLSELLFLSPHCIYVAQHLSDGLPLSINNICWHKILNWIEASWMHDKLQRLHNDSSDGFILTSWWPVFKHSLPNFAVGKLWKMIHVLYQMNVHWTVCFKHKSRVYHITTVQLAC